MKRYNYTQRIYFPRRTPVIYDCYLPLSTSSPTTVLSSKVQKTQYFQMQYSQVKCMQIMCAISAPFSSHQFVKT